MASKKKEPSLSFQDFIQQDRNKKKNEKLAQDIFGKGPRRNSTPTGIQKNKPLSGSFASRVGVQKRPSQSSKPNIDGQWTHDLHSEPDVPTRPRGALGRANSSAELRRGQKLMDAISRSPAELHNIQSHTPTPSSMSIKGLAHPGPFVVVASNFALGTSAEDIRAAIEPHATTIISCRLLSAKPTVMAEILFDDRESAQNVIDTFNGQKADGKQLYVYMKLGGPSPISKREQMQGPQPARSPAATPALVPAQAPAPRQPPEPEQEPAPTESDAMEIEQPRQPRTQDKNFRDYPQQQQQQQQQQPQQQQQQPVGFYEDRTGDRPNERSNGFGNHYYPRGRDRGYEGRQPYGDTRRGGRYEYRQYR